MKTEMGKNSCQNPGQVGLRAKPARTPMPLTMKITRNITPKLQKSGSAGGGVF